MKPNWVRAGSFRGHFVHWPRLALSLTLLAAFLLPIACHGQPKPDVGTFRCGFRVFQLGEGGQFGPRVAAVWYPTAAEEREFAYPRRSNFAGVPHSCLAPDAPPDRSRAPYPLIVFCHGAWGCALDSAYLCEYLARHGFVVAATDYDDAAPPDFARQVAATRLGPGQLMGDVREMAADTVGLVRLMAGRPREFLSYLEKRRLAPTRTLIDWLLEMNGRSDWPLAGMVDGKSVGIVGHSLGGMTAMALVGAHPDPAQRDDRIKAAVLLSAPVHPFQRTVAKIAVPVMVMHGDRDPAATGRLAQRSLAYDNAPPPKFYLILRDATHFAFSNPPRVDLWQAWQQDHRAAVICAYSTAFYRRYLIGRAVPELQQAPPETVAYYAFMLPDGHEKSWGTVPAQPRMNLRQILRQWLVR